MHKSRANADSTSACSKGGQLKNFCSSILCCLCALTAATTLLAQQAATPATAPKRASDYVNQELPRWLRVNGEYRVRFEGLGGSAFKIDSDDAYVLGRARVNTTIIPTSWMKFQFQGQDAQVWGRNPKPDAPPYEDTFDVRQAYVEFGNMESTKFSLVVNARAARALGLRVSQALRQRADQVIEDLPAPASPAAGSGTAAPPSTAASAPAPTPPRAPGAGSGPASTRPPAA